MDKPDHCTCEQTYDKHVCPFKDDMNNDKDSLCNCCPYCTYQCARDI